ncbi:hypothetical protein AOLI_G00202840 [Acnodon oligacanthus]
MVGSNFKEDHNVTFPPFSVFVEFVKRQAKARNDPNFATTFNTTLLHANHTSSYRKGKSTDNYNQKLSVTVHKTDVSSEGSKTKEAGEDIKRQCPIDHKPHPLKRCRGFRTTLLEDRKKLLKDNNICYRCLASTSHQANDCTVTIKCEEFDSEKHLAALHPGPAPQMSKPPSSLREHGGEQTNAQDSDVTATCTEVCGNKITGKSCSKICLVQVYPKGALGSSRFEQFSKWTSLVKAVTYLHHISHRVKSKDEAPLNNSDCGTNFIGASKVLKLDPSKPGETSVEDYLHKQRCSWVFSAPHSSHMGGTWECMIGISQRILDSMLLQAGKPTLTHEVLTTLMAEVTAIVSARPLVPVSSDPEAPLILTPLTLLTQKFDPIPTPPGDFTKADMYKHQWKSVQALADTFWATWQKEYLNMLQSCQKWQRNKPNFKEGDINDEGTSKK